MRARTLSLQSISHSLTQFSRNFNRFSNEALMFGCKTCAQLPKVRLQVLVFDAIARRDQSRTRLREGANEMLQTVGAADTGPDEEEFLQFVNELLGE